MAGSLTQIDRQGDAEDPWGIGPRPGGRHVLRELVEQRGEPVVRVAPLLTVS
jgi:hypothetical protein